MTKRETWVRLLSETPRIGDLLLFTRFAEREVNAPGPKMQMWRTAVSRIARNWISGGTNAPLASLIAYLDEKASAKTGTQRSYRSRAQRAVAAFAAFRDNPLSLQKVCGESQPYPSGSDASQKLHLLMPANAELEGYAESLRRIADCLEQSIERRLPSRREEPRRS